MERKVRSDKKRDVKPTMSRELKDCIYRLAYITDIPIKNVAERICIEGLDKPKVISYLSRNFRRNLRIHQTLYIGDLDRISVTKRTSHSQNERITIRFKSDTHEKLAALAYALDCSVSRATALLLDATVREIGFINDFAERFLKENIDDSRMKELEKILKYINVNNPYAEELSWAVMLSYLMKEVKVHAEKVQDKVNSFVISQWNKD